MICVACGMQSEDFIPESFDAEEGMETLKIGGVLRVIRNVPRGPKQPKHAPTPDGETVDFLIAYQLCLQLLTNSVSEAAANRFPDNSTMEGYSDYYSEHDKNNESTSHGNSNSNSNSSSSNNNRTAYNRSSSSSSTNDNSSSSSSSSSSYNNDSSSNSSSSSSSSNQKRSSINLSNSSHVKPLTAVVKDLWARYLIAWSHTKHDIINVFNNTKNQESDEGTRNATEINLHPLYPSKPLLLGILQFYGWKRSARNACVCCVLCCTVLCRTVLYCTVLYCTVLNCLVICRIIRVCFILNVFISATILYSCQFKLISSYSYVYIFQALFILLVDCREVGSFPVISYDGAKTVRTFFWSICVCVCVCVYVFVCKN